MIIKIIIVDDHELIIDGIKSILKNVIDISVIAVARNGFELLKLLESSTHPDIILMDVRMPIMDGIMTTRVLQKEYPEIRVLALSMYNQEQDVQEMMNAGAKGYMVKNAGKNEMLKAIYSIYARKTYLSKGIIKSNKPIESQNTSSNLKPLTRREKEILTLVAKGHTSQQIALSLSISKMTVDTHRKNIHKKLGISSNAGLIKYGLSLE